jgi:hypothetical protein
MQRIGEYLQICEQKSPLRQLWHGIAAIDER